MLSESLSKALLESYEIPVTRPHAARTADEAVEAAERLGYPVVVKIDSPQISHKTEVNGVVLDLPNAAAVREAFEQVTARARQMRPDAEIAGVTVQKMMTYPNSFELILGTKKDPVFGPVIMVGMGGVAAEVFQDRALGLPPLNDVLARRMLESLKSWPLLRGYRGKPGANIDRLIEIIMRFSYLVADYPEIKELDINPLLVTPEDVIALDARVVVDRQPRGSAAARPYSHLAIRPYPEEYVTQRKLKDGTPGRAAADQARGRAAVARTAGRLLDAVAVVPLQLLVQADDARDGLAVLLHRLRSRVGHRGRGRGRRPAEADRHRPAGGRRRPSDGRICGDRGRSLARPRAGRAADRLLPGAGEDSGA